MHRTLPILTSLLLLASGASAAAAANVYSASLTPNKQGKLTKLTLDAVTLPTESSLPTGFTLTLQKGFAPIARGGSSLCATNQESAMLCPPASLIGTGSLTVSPAHSVFGIAGPTFSVGLSFYLGAPQQAGCTGTVDVVYHVAKDVSLNLPSAQDAGNLCATGSGAAQISFTSLPTYAYNLAYTPMAIDQLSLSLGSTTGAVTGPWRTPSSCPKSHAWNGSAALAFDSPGATPSAVTLPFQLACK